MSKLHYRERCRGWHIVMMKDPVSGNVCMNPHYSLSESFKNGFVVILIVCPAGTHSLWIIPMESKKHTSMHSNFDLNMCAFFGLGDPFERHSKLWRLVSGSYCKNQLSSPVITCPINSGSDSTCSSSSAQTLTRTSHCCSVRFLAQTFLIPNSSVSIWRTASRLSSLHQQS